MRAVIQRVKEARVTIGSRVAGQIGRGVLVFLGVAKKDSQADADYLVRKISELRIFEDEAGKMNRSAIETGGEFLVVSQFTLLGSCEKGRRPSFDKAALPDEAEALYNYFVAELKKRNLNVETGEFQAMMDVSLVNDGPVTFILESL